MSRNAKLYALIEAFCLAATWIVWGPLLFLGHSSWNGELTLLLLIVMIPSLRRLKEKIGDEVTRDPLPLRRFSYCLKKSLCAVIVLGQLALAVYVRGVFVWVASSIYIVITGALFLHEWVELRELEKSMPNQTAEPRSPSRAGSP